MASIITIGRKMIVQSQPTTLRARYEAFVRTLEGFEDIDTLLESTTFAGKKRADYLFQNRLVIIEQKSLDVDPADKPQKFVEELIRRGEMVFWGTLSTEAIFRRMPNGDELRRRLALKIGKVIEDDVRKADKQTRDTREIFRIPSAAAILVLLNEDATTLFPDIVTHALANTFQKKNGNDFRYSNIDGVFLISEAHATEAPEFQKTFPVHSFLAPATERRKVVSTFMDMMMVQWARFNNATLIRPSE